MTISKKFLLVLTLFLSSTLISYANASKASSAPVSQLMDRIQPGLSKKIKVEITADTLDFFEISQQGRLPLIRANNNISAASGLNWYLKHVAGVHICWNNMHPAIPAKLPAVTSPIRMSTPLSMRYYLNYCTHSYSMAFWDWKRWEEEIDWMALHGINMPLAITGTDVVWRNLLRRLGYPEKKIDAFIAGPGFQAWWLMNNLEGWGGPNPPQYYRKQEALQKKIVKRMRQYGMEPVFAGYSGMVPHDAKEALGLDVADSGTWCSYPRPAFLQPTDKDFQRIAAIYYDELTKLYGTTRYYSMDPFHEGGNARGMDLDLAGKEIMRAMKHANPAGVWVIQGWQGNPRPAMVANLDPGDIAVLDLHAEATPLWSSPKRNHGKHEWLYCMLHNFGGNIGLYGRIPALCSEFGKARRSSTLRGTGLTMEGIYTNPVVYELMSELPWISGEVNPDQWIRTYSAARYGMEDQQVQQAWSLLLHSVYNCPVGNPQQGTRESVFCARPSDNPQQASTWSYPSQYYDPQDVYKAATLMARAAEHSQLADNENFLYDLIDITRQAIAEKGREVGTRINKAANSANRSDYAREASNFLRLIELQDSLLALHPSFRLDTHIRNARNAADSPAEADRYEWNLRTQITVWGNRAASEDGALHDYSHREWSGLLKQFYLPRWQKWFDTRLATWPDPSPAASIDFFPLEEPWTRLTTPATPAHRTASTSAPAATSAAARTILAAALSL